MSSRVTIIKQSSGNYNMFVTRDGMFVLQGNLTEAELKEFIAAAKKEMKK